MEEGKKELKREGRGAFMVEKDMLMSKIWAVVGANQKAEKYGNMIYKKLKLKDYQVYPVNPVYNEIEGDKCYKNLSELPVVPEVVCMVVSPDRAVAVLEEASKLGIKNIWFQPGTYNDETIELIDKLELTAAYACVLVATR